MKREMVKMLALLLFGAAALSSCSIENNRGHRRYHNDRNDRYHDRDHDNHDRDHNYRNY